MSTAHLQTITAPTRTKAILTFLAALVAVLLLVYLQHAAYAVVSLVNTYPLLFQRNLHAASLSPFPLFSCFDCESLNSVRLRDYFPPSSPVFTTLPNVSTCLFCNITAPPPFPPLSLIEQLEPHTVDSELNNIVSTALFSSSWAARLNETSIRSMDASEVPFYVALYIWACKSIVLSEPLLVHPWALIAWAFIVSIGVVQLALLIGVPWMLLRRHTREWIKYDAEVERRSRILESSHDAIAALTQAQSDDDNSNGMGGLYRRNTTTVMPYQ